jgi:hypothetical protein
MNADGSGQRRLTGNGDGLAWSPDRQKIAPARDGVYVMTPTGAGSGA